MPSPMSKIVKAEFEEIESGFDKEFDGFFAAVSNKLQTSGPSSVTDFAKAKDYINTKITDAKTKVQKCLEGAKTICADDTLTGQAKFDALKDKQTEIASIGAALRTALTTELQQHFQQTGVADANLQAINTQVGEQIKEFNKHIANLQQASDFSAVQAYWQERGSHQKIVLSNFNRGIAGDQLKSGTGQISSNFGFNQSLSAVGYKDGALSYTGKFNTTKEVDTLMNTMLAIPGDIGLKLGRDPKADSGMRANVIRAKIMADSGGVFPRLKELLDNELINKEAINKAVLSACPCKLTVEGFDFDVDTTEAEKKLIKESRDRFVALLKETYASPGKEYTEVLDQMKKSSNSQAAQVVLHSKQNPPQSDAEAVLVHRRGPGMGTSK